MHIESHIFCLVSNFCFYREKKPLNVSKSLPMHAELSVLFTSPQRTPERRSYGISRYVQDIPTFTFILPVNYRKCHVSLRSDYLKYAPFCLVKDKLIQFCNRNKHPNYFPKENTYFSCQESHELWLLEIKTTSRMATQLHITVSASYQELSRFRFSLVSLEV